MTGFADGEEQWVAQLDGLRNLIRQEVVARQLGEHVTPGATVLDVGCGQGTQALRLAARGCRVTGVDASPSLLARFAAGAAAVDAEVELINGRLEELDDLVGDRRFDVVCAHGLLMYLEDRRAAIEALGRRVAPSGRLSITFRNGHALAFRPAMRGRWADALAAFDTREYVNELGVLVTADHLDDVRADLAAIGLDVVAWFGIRVFNDGVDPAVAMPEPDALRLLLDAEDEAGRRDPYRWLASQFHVIAGRP